jgi:hypothetical protein
MSSQVLTRVLFSVLAGTLCGTGVTCGVLVATGASDRVGVQRTGPTGPVVGHRPVDPGRAREVLRAWDADRARAWVAGDPAGLGRLYTTRSVAGRRDVAMLRAWSERDARLTGLTTQVLRLQVLVEREHRLVLVVTDRVSAVAGDQAGVLSLPSDRPSIRRITLVRTDVGQS